jgi:hypothetical protein
LPVTTYPRKYLMPCSEEEACRRATDSRVTAYCRSKRPAPESLTQKLPHRRL